MDLNQGAIEEILVGLVKEIIETTETIDRSASLFDDLGLDSIDFLDLTSSIERIYGIKISPQELFGGIEELPRPEEMLDEDGMLSQKAIELLKANNPEIPSDGFTQEMLPEDIPRLLSIRLLSRIVLSRLALGQPALANDMV